MSKVRACISIEPTIFEELSKMSEQEERSISQQISYLVKKNKEKTESQKEEVE
jgi:hypothetical protein